MQILLEEIIEEPLLAECAFILHVKQPFISAAAVCGLHTAVIVLVTAL